MAWKYYLIPGIGGLVLTISIYQTWGYTFLNWQWLAMILPGDALIAILTVFIWEKINGRITTQDH